MSLYSAGRLSEETDEELVASGSFPYFNRRDQLKPIADAVHAFDKAHTLMLAEEGLVPKAAAARILQELLAIEGEDLLQTRLATGEGIHSGEAHLRMKLGSEIGGYIHLGRSTPDLKGIPVRIAMRNRLVELSKLIVLFRDLLLSQALRYKNVVMPSYDRVFQRGEVTTFGSELLESLDTLERTHERIEALYGRVNRRPPYYIDYLGIDTNSARIAELLGFAGRVEIVLNWDDLVECLSSLCILNRCMSGLASKLGHWFSPEVKLIDIADRYCVTSSIRPQKRNPAAIEFVVGVEGSAIGHFTACTALLRGIGAEAYQMSVLHLWPAMALSKRALKIMIGLFSSLVLNERQMKARAGEAWAQAPYLAACIVEKEDLPWRIAHQLVAEAIDQVESSTVARRIDRDILNHIARTRIDRELSLTTEEINQTLSELQVQDRVRHVEDTVKRMQHKLDQDRKWLESNRKHLHRSEQLLDDSVASFVRNFAHDRSSASG